MFEYDGACNISSAKIVDENLQEHSLNIKRIIVTWDRMGKGDNDYNWDYLTTDWNKLLNNRRNDYVDLVRYRTISGAKTKYTEKIPASSKNKKDRTKASYWSCNLPRYHKQLGLATPASTFW